MIVFFKRLVFYLQSSNHESTNPVTGIPLGARKWTTDTLEFIDPLTGESLTEELFSDTFNLIDAFEEDDVDYVFTSDGSRDIYY